jgi:hypothetical protein
MLKIAYLLFDMLTILSKYSLAHKVFLGYLGVYYYKSNDKTVLIKRQIPEGVI